MRKFLLFTTALLLSVAMQAQQWQMAPSTDDANVANTKHASQRATITPEENQAWWGYFTGNESRGAVGVSGTDTYHQAIYLPADNPITSNKTIKAVRFYLRNTSCLSDLKIWISKALPVDFAEADYVQELDLSTLQGGDEGDNCGLVNDVALNADYTIDGAVYVGYSFTVTKATTSAGKYPTVYGGDGNENGLFLRTNKTVPEWGPQNQFGNLALQVLLEGSFSHNSVMPVSFKEKASLTGSFVNVPVKIMTLGSEAVRTVSYTITKDGNTSEEKTVTISPAFSGIGTTTEVTIPFEGDDHPGISSRTLTITKVNGEDNEASVKSVEGTIRTVSEIIPRIVLIEEFTTEKCGYCPEAATGLAKTFTTYPDLKDQVAIVCHHSGYGTDWLTINADKSYQWFYNDGGSTYAPAFMWDRYAENGVTPVEGRPANAAGHKAKIDSRLEELPSAAISLNAKYNEDLTQIAVEADCKRLSEFGNTPARITLILTEDNIKAKSQSGASGTFIHQHVSRAVNSTWGEVLEWDNNNANYSYTFDLDSGWKLEDLKVVAFVSGYDSTNPANCTVENAAVTIPDASTTAIRSIFDQNNTTAIHYNAAGQAIKAPQKGINLIRRTDGTIRKIFVR